jgi:hypothetical protein
MALRPLALACLLSCIGTCAMAQACSSRTANTRLSASAIQGIVNSKYVCVGTFPDATWNELHAGGTLIDYRKGPNDSADPTTTVGRYTIAPGANGGIITYDYDNNGGTYSYTIEPAGAHQYTFCPVAGAGQVVTASIQQNHC